MIAIIKKICNIMAAACLVFDVDWDEEYEDDEYVCETRREKIYAVQMR